VTVEVLLALAWLQVSSQESFSARADLQGLYDEISQSTLQFQSARDVDPIHEVLYTSDWVFVDASGQRHAWPEVREEAVGALATPRADSMTQSIRTLSLAPGGATVLVNVTTVRTIVDNDGRYGRKGSSHTLTETTVFRDGWVKVSDEWKVKSREQIGRPKLLVDKPPSEWWQ